MIDKITAIGNMTSLGLHSIRLNRILARTSLFRRHSLLNSVEKMMLNPRQKSHGQAMLQCKKGFVRCAETKYIVTLGG